MNPGTVIIEMQGVWDESQLPGSKANPLPDERIQSGIDALSESTELIDNIARWMAIYALSLKFGGLMTAVQLGYIVTNAIEQRQLASMEKYGIDYYKSVLDLDLLAGGAEVLRYSNIYSEGRKVGSADEPALSVMNVSPLEALRLAGWDSRKHEHIMYALGWEEGEYNRKREALIERGANVAELAALEADSRHNVEELLYMQMLLFPENANRLKQRILLENSVNALEEAYTNSKH